jgi:hypothetical protein
MRDEDKTKEDLLKELAVLRERLVEAQRRNSERAHEGAKFRGLLDRLHRLVLGEPGLQPGPESDGSGSLGRTRGV